MAGTQMSPLGSLLESGVYTLPDGTIIAAEVHESVN